MIDRSSPNFLIRPDRLQQFLAWLIPATFMFALIELVASALSRAWQTLLIAGILFGYGLLLLLARRGVRRGQVHRPVRWICLGMLIAALLAAPVRPEWAPVLVLIPLLAVAIALPYIGRRAFRQLILSSLTATWVIVLVGEFLPPHSSLPAWYTIFFRAGALVAIMATALLLLWQFRSQLTETLSQARRVEERYALAARGTNDGLWDWDLEKNEIFYSPRWKEMLGHTEEDIGGSPEEWLGRIHPDDSARVRNELAAHFRGDTPYLQSEHRVLHRDGSYRWMLCRGLAVRDVDGRPTRIVGSQTDITGRKRIEEQLLHDALYDVLTGLPNRALFLDRLDHALQLSKRNPDYYFAVLFLDLDRFKVVNDSLGHSTGDHLLVAVADRLRGCVRESDMVARLGGDEFAILLENMAGRDEAISIAERIQDVLSTPFYLDGYRVVSLASIGIAPGAERYRRPEELLRDADTAMYRAKAAGRARYEIFDLEMHNRAMALLQLETDLRQALEREEFLIHYQPIVSLRNGRIYGFEALIRWKHPLRGLVTPQEFIPVIEETGLIVPTGQWVLREACRQLSDWQAQYAPATPLTISINFSRLQFLQPDLGEQLRALLSEFRLDPSYVRLEVTESAIMESGHAGAITTLRQMIGIQLYLDDFGTGYSSLSTLHSFPFDALKIDRSFVGRIAHHEGAEEIIRTIVVLAHNLGMDVIAEGIETETQLAYLRTIGCDYGQGYLFAKPLSPEGAEQLIQAAPHW